MKNKIILLILLITTLTTSLGARAELVIRITESISDGIPIMIVPFPGSRASAIIADDLKRSGTFTIVNPSRAGQPLQLGQPFQPVLLKNSGAHYAVVGRRGNGLEFEIIDAATGQRIAFYNVPPGVNPRRMAHQAADLIYERLTGIRGAFDTRIAYISAAGPAGNQTYYLMTADIDGFNEQVLLTSRKPIMSPAWSPDGRRLAYVSFESGRSAIYVMDLSTRNAYPIANEGGMNGAPAWSPDGSKIAMSLSQNGNADIYVLSTRGGAPRRITTSPAIDTEPAWINDNSLMYTSNQGGRPQLYRTSVAGGNGSRYTYGGENSAASVLGNKVAMVRTNGNTSRIVIQNAAGGGTTVISDGKGRDDESPTLAPNGQMIIYSTKKGGRDVMVISNSKGTAHQTLSAPAPDVSTRDAAWSPYLN